MNSIFFLDPQERLKSKPRWSSCSMQYFEAQGVQGRVIWHLLILGAECVQGRRWLQDGVSGGGCCHESVPQLWSCWALHVCSYNRAGLLPLLPQLRQRRPLGRGGSSPPASKKENKKGKQQLCERPRRIGNAAVNTALHSLDWETVFAWVDCCGCLNLPPCGLEASRIKNQIWCRFRDAMISW